MTCEQALVYKDNAFQMEPPQFQPLRLWTPRVAPMPGGGYSRAENTARQAVVLPAHAFTMRGGFMNTAGGERRMVIAGKIFRHQKERVDVAV